MRKLVLMSVLIATFAIPMSAWAKKLDPRRTTRLVQKRLVWFCVIYVIVVLYVAPRLFH